MVPSSMSASCNASAVALGRASNIGFKCTTQLSMGTTTEARVCTDPRRWLFAGSIVKTNSVSSPVRKMATKATKKSAACPLIPPPLEAAHRQHVNSNTAHVLAECSGNERMYERCWPLRSVPLRSPCTKGITCPTTATQRRQWFFIMLAKKVSGCKPQTPANKRSSHQTPG